MAQAIAGSAIYGHGEIDWRGLREKTIESGLSNIKRMVGGNLVVGKQDWQEVDRKFKDMGFDRVYPPGTMPDQFIADLKADFSLQFQKE